MPIRCASWRKGPVAGALAVSGSRKRVFGLDNATGRLFEIHTKTLAVTPLELKKCRAACAPTRRQPHPDLFEQQKTLRLLDTVSKGRAASGQRCDAHRRAVTSSLDGQIAYVLPTVADDLLTVDIKSGRSPASCPSPRRRVECKTSPSTRTLPKSWPWLPTATRVLFLDTTTHKPRGPDLSLGRAGSQHRLSSQRQPVLRARRRQDLLRRPLDAEEIQKNIELAPGGTFRVLAVDGRGKRLYASGNHEINGRARRGDQQRGAKSSSSSTSIPARRPTSTTRRSRACSIWSRLAAAGTATR